MEIFKLYENVLREEDTARNTQSCIRHFGNELFGDQISYKEPNTSIETKFVDMIYNFTDYAYGTQLSTDNPGFIAAMNKLQSCMSTYPEILVPQGGEAYRGLSLTLDKAIALYEKVNGKSEFKLSYKPMHYIESWTEEQGIGANFAHMAETHWLVDIAKAIKSELRDSHVIQMINDELTTPAYLEASKIGFLLTHKVTPDQFLFKAKYFGKLSRIADEKEVIRLSDSPILCQWSLVTPELFTVLIPYLIKFKDNLTIFS